MCNQRSWLSKAEWETKKNRIKQNAFVIAYCKRRDTQANQIKMQFYYELIDSNDEILVRNCVLKWNLFHKLFWCFDSVKNWPFPLDLFNIILIYASHNNKWVWWFNSVLDEY